MSLRPELDIELHHESLVAQLHTPLNFTWIIILKGLLSKLFSAHFSENPIVFPRK